MTLWNSPSILSPRVKNLVLYLNSLTVKIGQIGCAETSVRNYHYSLCNNPEECSSHLRRGGSLKSTIRGAGFSGYGGNLCKNFSNFISWITYWLQVPQSQNMFECIKIAKIWIFIFHEARQTKKWAWIGLWWMFVCHLTTLSVSDAIGV